MSKEKEQKFTNFNEEDAKITLIYEDGEKDYEILFTYHSDTFNKDYVFIIDPEDENEEQEEVLVFSYNEKTKTLTETSDEEFKELEEVFETFNSQEEID